MKKAKIMLAAIAVIGVVSGALAFKAKHFQSLAWYTYTADASLGTGCFLTVFTDYTTAIVEDPTPHNILYYPTTLETTDAGACTFTPAYIND